MARGVALESFVSSALLCSRRGRGKWRRTSCIGRRWQDHLRPTALASLGPADYTYYKFREAGIDAHAELLVQAHEHNHSADADANSGKIWGPDVEVAAQRWMREVAKPSRHGLQTYLVTQNFKNLPNIERIGGWLKRFQLKLKAEKTKSGEDVDKPAGTGMLNFAEAKTLEAWRSPKEIAPTTLQIRIPPVPIMSERLCICFSCDKMVEALTRYDDFELHLGVDVKQGTMTGQAGVATISLQAKDKLRGTTFSKGDAAGQGRVQGRAYTTHGVPVLQAILSNIEHRRDCEFHRLLSLPGDRARQRHP